jgi:hypothetical protein
MSPQPFVRARFEYRDPNGRPSFCHIEAIVLQNERVAVITSESADNPGMSITNAAELVAAAVCNQLRIDPDKLVLIEHYDSTSYRSTARPDSFDLVTFNVIAGNSDPVFQHPAWRPMQPSDWHDLGLTPRG